MNTDRDNFHDWARDKPETGFSTISRPDFYQDTREPGIFWGRWIIYTVLAIALAVAIKYLAGR
ncbi:MAG: hypothetical protein KKC85_07200 [Gammaproteobacteria bacterium]|nr:hypothetical protein [Gammaproteobacteria bacterium]MBU1443076.1 hypothetical protein [Gammaproteobacteria bacterium]MBU2286204.1 hypothetical protein [Gammaproteobacteria bacterium]